MMHARYHLRIAFRRAIPRVSFIVVACLFLGRNFIIKVAHDALPLVAGLANLLASAHAA